MSEIDDIDGGEAGAFKFELVKLSLEVGAVGSTRRLNGWFQAYWFFFFVTHIETKCILKRPVGKKKIDLRWKKLLDDVTYTM